MTGGGTAGHVTPNLALVPRLKEKGYEIKYIGSKTGIEKEIITNENIPYFEISSGKLRRYLDAKNFTDGFRVVKGVADAHRILSKEKPDIVFSKGGFVAVPVVMAASMMGIPVIAHESDITPGLANKLSQKFVTKMCVTFPESAKYIKDDKAVITGTPIRAEISNGSKEKAKEICGFTSNKEVILIIGGSLGSKIINDTIRESLDELLKSFNIIHLCGKGNLDESLINKEGYKQIEYASEELPDLFAVSDYIISRAGANSIFEFLHLQKPNLLIPLSRKASRGDQILNAESFEKHGYSLVIDEDELSREKLLTKLGELVSNKNMYINNMKNSSFGNGVEKIMELILKYSK